MVPKSYNIFSATNAVTSDSLVHDVTMINQGQIDKNSYELESASDFFPDPESDLTIVSVLSDFESDCSSIDFSDVESECGSDSSWGSSFESIAISDLDYNDECETNSEFEDEKETDLDLTIVTDRIFETRFHDWLGLSSIRKLHYLSIRNRGLGAFKELGGYDIWDTVTSVDEM
ncbi:uncharacterized protein LOC135693011, partial [Rhopilema esculentum]|uniref:uncharacterized protein LOC135693011 n=1 Tax=Rhopilema esculentum TaxID=499914 RepID=UPI0031D61C9D